MSDREKERTEFIVSHRNGFFQKLPITSDLLTFDPVFGFWDVPKLQLCLSRPVQDVERYMQQENALTILD